MTGHRQPVVHLVTTGSADEGRGHVSRSLTIADALVAAGAAVTFEMRRGSLTGPQLRGLRALGIEPGHGVARRSAAGARLSGGAVVVLDLPDPNELAGWWDPGRLVVFDDREQLRDAAAIVVQPSLPSWHGAARAGLVLAGYAYAPIRPGLRRLAEGLASSPRRERLVVCFGGSDPADVSGRLVPAVAQAIRAPRADDPSRPAVAPPATVIVGPGYTGSLAPGPGWSVVRDPVDVDERLAGAELALIGGGTMKLELAMLGVPAIVVAVADDQLPVSPPFAATGAAWYLGDGRTIDPAVVAAAVRDLGADAARRARMAAAGRATVDGHGAQRIAAAILRLAG